MKALARPFLFVLLGAPAVAPAQEAPPLVGGAWRITCFNSSLGVETDRYRTMSFDQLMAFAEASDELQRDLGLFEERVSTTTSGLGLFLGVGFGRAKTVPTTSTTSTEVQVGVGLHTPREAMITYRNKGMDTSIVYCNLQSEISLETAFMLKGQWSRYVHWQVGLGANGGITVNNRMMLIEGRYLGDDEHPSQQNAEEMNKHTYGAKQAYYTRIFIPTGVKFRAGPRWQVGMDYRLGMGWQFVDGRAANTIELTGAAMIGAKYCFR